MTTNVAEKHVAFVSMAISDLGQTVIHEIAAELRRLLADTFALYMKTNNSTDEIAERARKLGVTTLRSIDDIKRRERLKDNDEVSVSPCEMLLELLTDHQQFIRFLRIAHQLCDLHRDVAPASLIENWIDQAERRSWFLAEIGAAA